MKTVITAVIATALFAGSAVAEGTIPCTKVQFWITSMDTVTARDEMHRDNYQINIANTVLRSRSRFAQEDYGYFGYYAHATVP